MIGSLETLKS